MKQHKWKLLLLDFIILIFFALLDRITKYLAISQLKGSTDVTVIPKVLELTYLENRGAAFSLLQNQKVFFFIATFIILCAIVYFLLHIPGDKKYIKLHILLSLIAAGAIGNLIDRIRFGYVVDFIYFSIINFPVFNVADICITVSTVVLAFCILFLFKEEDLSFLRHHKKADASQKDTSEQETE